MVFSLSERLTEAELVGAQNSDDVIQHICEGRCGLGAVFSKAFGQIDGVVLIEGVGALVIALVNVLSSQLAILEVFFLDSTMF